MYRLTYPPILNRDRFVWTTQVTVNSTIDMQRQANKNSRSKCWPTYLGQYIGQVSVDMSTDISVECRSICWPIYRLSVGWHIDRYISRGVHKILMIQYLCQISWNSEDWTIWNPQVSAQAFSLNFLSNCACTAFNWVLSVIKKKLRITGFCVSLPFLHCVQLGRKIAHSNNVGVEQIKWSLYQQHVCFLQSLCTS